MVLRGFLRVSRGALREFARQLTHSEGTLSSYYSAPIKGGPNIQGHTRMLLGSQTLLSLRRGSGLREWVGPILNPQPCRMPSSPFKAPP